MQNLDKEIPNEDNKLTLRKNCQTSGKNAIMRLRDRGIFRVFLRNPHFPHFLIKSAFYDCFTTIFAIFTVF